MPGAGRQLVNYYIFSGQGGTDENGLPTAVDLRPQEGDERWSYALSMVQRFDGNRWRPAPSVAKQEAWPEERRQREQRRLETNVHSMGSKWVADGKNTKDWKELCSGPLIRHPETGKIMRVDREHQLVHAAQRSGGQGSLHGGSNSLNSAPAPEPIQQLPVVLPKGVPEGSYITHPRTGEMLIYLTLFRPSLGRWKRQWRPLDRTFDIKTRALIKDSPLYKPLDALSTQLQGKPFTERLPLMGEKMVDVLKPKLFVLLPAVLRELLAAVDVTGRVSEAMADLVKAMKVAAVLSPPQATPRSLTKEQIQMLEDERNGLEPWGLDNMPEAEWLARLREMPRCLPPSRAGSKRVSRAVLIFFDTEFRQQSKQDRMNESTGDRRKRHKDLGAYGVDTGGEGVAEDEFSEEDSRGMEAAAWERFLEHIYYTDGLPLCWGSPELSAFREAGRPDGCDACPLLKKAFQTPIGPSCDKPFSFSMGVLVPLFLGILHEHTALADSKHEALIFLAILKALINHYISTNEI